ncbi:MAG TPA: hypothetical protein VFA22_11125 [Stellaceae bacterium]|nr:hypothetical protein [Stellaceae bacterium]
MRTSSTLGIFRRPGAPAGRRFSVGRCLKVLAAAAVIVAALAMLFANQPPGPAIRDDLESVAGALALMPAATEPRAVAAALHAALRGRTITVDADAFPAIVYVTLRGLDKASCAGAVASARRLEGLVVIDLEHFRSAADCRDSNDMTWRLMP